MATDWSKWVGHALTIIPTAGFSIMFVIQSANKTDATAAALQALASDVHEMRQDLKLLPGYEARIVALERNHGEYQGMFGALDGRLRVVEDTGARNSQDVANLKAASQVRLR